MSTTTTIKFSATTLAATFDDAKNRAVQVRQVGVAIVDLEMDSKELYNQVNEAFQKKTKEDLAKSKLSKQAIDNLTDTYTFARDHAFLDHDRHVAKAINVIEKRQQAVIDKLTDDLNALDQDEDGYLGTVYRLLMEANQAALEARKKSQGSKSKGKGDDEDGDDDDAESLVTVIIHNLRALDVAGTTADERNALLDEFEKVQGRIFAAK